MSLLFYFRMTPQREIAHQMLAQRLLARKMAENSAKNVQQKPTLRSSVAKDVHLPPVLPRHFSLSRESLFV